MRLIDADALKQTMIETMEALLKNPKMDNQEAHLLAAFHTVGKMINDAPTVSPDMAQVLEYECGKDSVQAVRCKDCRHTNARSKDGENFHCGMFNLWMRHDFYCKYGIKSETKALVCSPQNMSTVMSSGMDTAIRYERANNCSDGERRETDG